MNTIWKLSLLIILALILAEIPYVSAPLKWFETFFHEFSHGLGATLTGGSIKNVNLQFTGSGTCRTQGGTNLITTFSGYAGASIWGSMIFMSAKNISTDSAKAIVFILLSTISVVCILYARDIQTIIIMLIMATILSFILNFQKNNFVKHCIEFIGIYILVASIKSPTYLFAYSKKGDAHALKEISGIPEIIWIGLWELIGLSLITLVIHKAIKYPTDNVKQL